MSQDPAAVGWGVTSKAATSPSEFQRSWAWSLGNNNEDVFLCSGYP